MPHASFDPTTRTIRVATVWSEKELIRSIPGARYDGLAKQWHVPATWTALVQLRGVFGEAFTLDQSLIDWAWELRRAWVDPALDLRSRFDGIADDDESIEGQLIRSWRGTDA